MATRPDLVYGARDLHADAVAERTRIGFRAFVVAGLLVAVTFAAVVSQFAGSDPDGLQRVAADQGFADTAEEHTLADSLFAGYATEGLRNETLSLAIAGLTGVVISLAVGSGVILAVRDRKQASQPKAASSPRVRQG